MTGIEDMHIGQSGYDPDGVRGQLLGALAVGLLNQRVQQITDAITQSLVDGFGIKKQTLHNPKKPGIGYRFELQFPEFNNTDLLDIETNPIEVTAGPYTVEVRFSDFEYPSEDACHVVEDVYLSPEEILDVQNVIIQLWAELKIAEQLSADIADADSGEEITDDEDGWEVVHNMHLLPDDGYDAEVEFLNAFGLCEGDRVVWVTNGIGGNHIHDEVISWDYFTRSNMINLANHPGYIIHGEYIIVQIVPKGMYSIAYLVED